MHEGEALLGYGPTLDDQQAQELVDAYRVAWYHALGLDADDIAQQLETSRATVYRLLNEAERNRLLDSRPRVALPTGPGAALLLQEVERTDLGERVREAFAERLGAEAAPFEVLVAPSVGVPQQDPEERRREMSRRVGRVAARRVMRGILHNGARIIGINWGFHCWRLSHALPGDLFNRIPESHAADIRFFPLAGSIGVLDEHREHLIQETSANANAVRCVENLNQYAVRPDRTPARGKEADNPPIPVPLELTQPCVIPLEEGPESVPPDTYLQHVWRFIASDKSVQAIFGRQWALARLSGEEVPTEPEGGTLLQRAHALITGLSTVDYSRAVRIGAIEQEFVERARAANAVGELSAHYFCHLRDYPECREDLRNVNLRVLAPTLEDYVACTRRARQLGRGLGTVLLASQARKAEAVEAAVSHGAVNIFVCDEELARALI